MDRLELLKSCFPWFIQISTYIFFSIAVVWLMQIISIAYHASDVTVGEESICFSMKALLLLLVVIFSAFRYVRQIHTSF